MTATVQPIRPRTSWTAAELMACDFVTDTECLCTDCSAWVDPYADVPPPGEPPAGRRS